MCISAFIVTIEEEMFAPSTTHAAAIFIVSNACLPAYLQTTSFIDSFQPDNRVFFEQAINIPHRRFAE